MNAEELLVGLAILMTMMGIIASLDRGEKRDANTGSVKADIAAAETDTAAAESATPMMKPGSILKRVAFDHCPVNGHGQIAGSAQGALFGPRLASPASRRITSL